MSLLSVCVPLLHFFSFVYFFRSEASEVPLLISRIACRSMHMWSFFHPESSLVYSTCFLFLLLIIHNVFRFKFSNPEEVCRQRDRATVRTNVHECFSWRSRLQRKLGENQQTLVTFPCHPAVLFHMRHLYPNFTLDNDSF